MAKRRTVAKNNKAGPSPNASKKNKKTVEAQPKFIRVRLDGEKRNERFARELQLMAFPRALPELQLAQDSLKAVAAAAGLDQHTLRELQVIDPLPELPELKKVCEELSHTLNLLENHTLAAKAAFAYDSLMPAENLLRMHDQYQKMMASGFSDAVANLTELSIGRHLNQLAQSAAFNSLPTGKELHSLLFPTKTWTDKLSPGIIVPGRVEHAEYYGFEQIPPVQIMDQCNVESHQVDPPRMPPSPQILGISVEEILLAYLGKCACEKYNWILTKQQLAVELEQFAVDHEIEKQYIFEIGATVFLYKGKQIKSGMELRRAADQYYHHARNLKRD